MNSPHSSNNKFGCASIPLSLILLFFVLPVTAGIYTVRSPRYTLYRLGRAIEDRDQPKIEKIIDVDAVTKDIVDTTFAQATQEYKTNLTKTDNPFATWMGEAIGVGLINALRPTIEAFAAEFTRDLLRTAIAEGEVQEGITLYLITQRIEGSRNQATLFLRIDEATKAEIGLPNGINTLEVELERVEDYGWRIVGFSEETIKALASDWNIDDSILR